MIERRELFRIAAAGAVAPLLAQTKDWSKQPPRFFTAVEHETLKKLVDAIIPADAEGGGALAAGVPYFIDTMVLYADAETQKTWRAGLAMVTTPEQLAALATKESSPSTPAEQFFVRLKSITIQGWAMSDEGSRYLGYEGNVARSEFPGCTHPEHQR